MHGCIVDFARLLKRRPLLCISCSALALSAAGLILPGWVKLLCAMLFVCAGTAAMLVLWHQDRLDAPFAILALMLLAAGIASGSSYGYFNFRVGQAQRLIDDSSGQTVRAEGWCISTSFVSDYASSHTVHLTALDGTRVSLDAVLEGSRPFDLNPGESFSVSVTLHSIENDGVSNFDLAQYRLSKGVLLVCRDAENPDFLYEKESGFHPRVFFARLNERFSSRLRVLLGKRAGNLSAALFLGNRSQLEDACRLHFRRLGISHLLALSGMHMSILLTLLRLLLKRLPLHKSIRLCIEAAAAVFYAALTGFSLSVVRCLLMLLCGYAMTLLGERIPTHTNLLCGTAFFLCLRPRAILDIGFLLSVGATLGMTTAGAAMSRLIWKTRTRNPLRRMLRRLANALSASLSCMLFTLPLSWLFFGSFSPLAPLSTLLFSPLAACILLLTPLLLLSAPIGWLCTPIAAVLKAVSLLTLSLAEALSRKFGLLISLRYDFLPLLLIGSALLFLLMLLLRFPPVRSGVLACAVCAAAFALCTELYAAQDRDVTHFFYLHQGKSEGVLLIRNQDVLLCDISDGGYAVSRQAIALCEENRRLEIDTYLLTHYHKRHISTVNRVLDTVSVGQLLLPESCSEQDESIQAALLEAARSRGIAVSVYPHTQQSLLDCAPFSAAIPAYASIRRSTHPIIALRLSDGQRNFLYCGGSCADCTTLDFVQREFPLAYAVVFGSHPPINKNLLYPGENPDAILFFGDAQTAAMVSLPDTQKKYLPDTSNAAALAIPPAS